MHVQSCCFAHKTNCFFALPTVFVVVVVVVAHGSDGGEKNLSEKNATFVITIEPYWEYEHFWLRNRMFESLE